LASLAAKLTAIEGIYDDSLKLFQVLAYQLRYGRRGNPSHYNSLKSNMNQVEEGLKVTAADILVNVIADRENFMASQVVSKQNPLKNIRT
jgi:hypothetical protein